MELSNLLDFSLTSKDDSSELSKRLSDLNQHTLQEIMTPRSILNALDVDVQLKRVRRLRSAKVGYFPVYQGDLDNILGWISKTKILDLLEMPVESLDLRQYVKPAAKISDETPLSELAEHFLKTRSPFLIVTNQEGQTQGIVTLAEFVELLFGFDLEIDNTPSSLT